MLIKGFKIGEDGHYMPFIDSERMLFHTGTYDRNGIPINEGDMIRSKSCEIPFKVENIVDFLLMCGRYEEKHGAPIFDSLEVIDDK